MAKKRVNKDELINPGHWLGAKVVNGNIEAALRFWKKNLKESGVLDELKERREFLKPSVINRKKKADAIRREQLNVLRNQ